MPTQQIKPSSTGYNIASLAKLGITPDELGQPTPWSDLIRRSPPADLQHTSQLLADMYEPMARDFLTGLADRELCFVADFLNSLGVPFFFVAWDHDRSDAAQLGGPDRQGVLALLNHDHHQHQPHAAGPENDRLNRIWLAVNMLLDELRHRNTASFALVWESGRSGVPEFENVGDDREVSWKALWQSLPLDDRCHVSRDPPPRSRELDLPRPGIAPPSRTEPDPGNCGRIVWPKFQGFNFDRQPDWRWNRAFALVMNGRYISRRRDDPETGQAVRFLRALVKPVQDLKTLATQLPDLWSAHEIRMGPADQRIELEARVLARQSSPQIAERLNLSVGAIDAHLLTFFDVQSRLDSPIYITKKAIGVNSAWGSRFVTPDTLLKMVAYFGGPAVLDAVLPYLKNNGRQLAQRTSGDEGPIVDPLAERMDLLLRASNLPSDEKMANQLLRVTGQLLLDFSTTRPQQQWVGAFSQIIEPFTGELVATGKQSTGDISESHAA